MNEHHILWQFETDAERQAAFEQAYSPEGIWAVFFRTDREFLGTELLKDAGGAPRYVTIDRWTSREAYDRFRAANAEGYAALDRRTGALTTRESFLGDGSALASYRRWFVYEKDAHAKVLASLETVPATARESRQFRHACTLLAHLVMARRLWLHRFGERASGPTEFFPEGMTPATIAALLSETESEWEGYLAGAGDRELARVFAYRSLEGPEFTNRVEDILAQLFGHSWYHRGQIAQLVRSLGGTPAVTDFVYWCREPFVR